MTVTIPFSAREEVRTDGVRSCQADSGARRLLLALELKTLFMSKSQSSQPQTLERGGLIFSPSHTFKDRLRMLANLSWQLGKFPA